MVHKTDQKVNSGDAVKFETQPKDIISSNPNIIVGGANSSNPGGHSSINVAPLFNNSPDLLPLNRSSNTTLMMMGVGGQQS